MKRIFAWATDSVSKCEEGVEIGQSSERQEKKIKLLDYYYIYTATK
jgi:hypothetical protein